MEDDEFQAWSPEQDPVSWEKLAADAAQDGHYPEPELIPTERLYSDPEGLYAHAGVEAGSYPLVDELVETVTSATSWHDKMRAFNALDSWREQHSEGSHRDAVSAIKREAQIDAPRSDGRRQAGRLEQFRKTLCKGKQKDRKPALRTKLLSGEIEWRELRNDETAIREFIEARAKKIGRTFDALVFARTQRRLPSTQQKLYDELAVIVAEAMERGAKLEAVGRVLGGIEKQRVFDLVKRADLLAERAAA